jgi:beta-lactamase regulating signal transducer with metallopeptidase domain
MGATIETLNELAAFWSIAMQRATWQGGLAIAAAWALIRCWPGLPARVACCVWRLADLKLIVALLWAAPLLLPLLPPSGEGKLLQAQVAAPELLPSVARGPARSTSLVGKPAPNLVDQRLSPVSVVLVLWLTGVIGAVALAGRDAITVTRLRRSCPVVGCPDSRDAAADLARILGLRSVPEVRAGPGVDRPMLVGAFRPAILLPESMLCDPRSTAAIRPVLAHELAHVCRRDLLWSVLAWLARALFFFHPLVWLAHREALLAREAACDGLALWASGVRPSEYGRILLEIATRGPGRPARWTATLGMAGSCGSLKRRLIAMKTTQQPSRRRVVSWACALVVIGATGVIPWRLVARQANGQEPLAVQTARTKQTERAAKPTRVLYLVGPDFSWNMRYVVRGVAQVKDIQLDAYKVRMAGSIEDTEFAAGRYDVYVLDNLPADRLTKAQQKKLVEAVELGAGVIFLGGTASYGAGGWGRSELVRLIPTDVGPNPDWMEPAAGVRVIPQAIGLASSLMALGASAQESARIWDGLPALLGVNRLGALKPTALLLAKTDGGDAFLVGQNVGKGRVLAIAGETWLWARAGEEPRAAHHRFWESAIRWASQRDRIAGDPGDR